MSDFAREEARAHSARTLLPGCAAPSTGRRGTPKRRPAPPCYALPEARNSDAVPASELRARPESQPHRRRGRSYDRPPPSVCLAGRAALIAPRAQLFVALLRSVTRIEVRRHVGILHLPAACTRQQRLHFLSEALHLVFHFGPFKTARLEPGMEHEIVVTAVLLDLHDLGAHVGRRAEKCDLLLQQRV